MLWLLSLCVVLIILVFVLLFKIILLRRAVDEIRIGFQERLEQDTNTLIAVSSGDRRVRRLAAEINAQLRLLRKERRRLQNGDLEIREAVMNISHDLRTPLTAVCGYLDLLKREEKSEAAVRYLKAIENRTEALKQLMEELFRYSLTTSAPGGENEEVDLNRVLEESISAYYASLKGAGIEPEIVMPEKKIWRRLDKRALSRIFENIIGNAIKYSDGDLNIILSENGEIVFSNSASGLDEIQTGMLFDRFYTVETARKSTGLGLSIAKALTEQMGGEITAKYHEGQIIIRLLFAS